MGAESFTILAVLEANDRISRVLEHVDGSLDRMGSAATRAAELTAAAGERIDQSLLQTASGADAADLAQARLSAAQAKVASTAAAQAEAEQAVLDAQAQAAAAEDGDTAATERLTAANDALTAAQKRAALAAKEEAAAADHAAAVNRAQAASAGESAAAADAAAAAHSRLGASTDRAAASSGLLAKGMKVASVSVAAIGLLSVMAAGNFESMTQHLVTDAGESQKNLGMIRAGMLSIATATGTTTTQMAQGMYHIESAGFHGKAALDVLRTAAEGAKVGGADLDVMGKALTGTMNAFGPSAGTATQMMNAMIATVGAGDMKMQEFGASLGNVAAIAASAGLSYAQVGAAVATMTAQNVTAQRATMDLAHTISSLSNPSAVQIKEMQAMGINSISLSKNLGKNGLTGTFDMLVRAIAAHTKGGTVFVNSLNASRAAAAQANQVLAQMPASMQKVAKGWESGSMSTASFKKAIDGLPPSQQKMYLAFESLVKKSGSFAESLKANTPQAQTFNATLAKMTGGTTSLNTILMLSGKHAGAFNDNVKTIAGAAQKAGDHVDNWSKIQGTFNQKMDRAKASVEAAGISIGTALLPAVSEIVGAVADFLGPLASWISHHQKLIGLIVAIIGPALAMVGVIKTIAIVTKLWETAQIALDAAMDANPIGLIIIAIVALAAGLIYAYTHFKTFRNIVNDVGSALKIAFLATVHALVVAWHALVTAAVVTWHALETAWRAVVTAALAVWHALQTAWNAVMSVTMTVWNAISGFFQKWWPLLLVIFMPFVAIIISIWNNFHTQIIGTAKSVWNTVIGFLAGVWGVIQTAAKTAWDLFKTAVIHPVEEVWNLIQPIIHKVESFLSGVWNAVLSTVTTIWNDVKNAIITPLTSAWHTVTTTVDHIKSAIKTGLDNAWNAVSDIGNKFMSIGKAIIDGIKQGVENAAGDLAKSVKNAANSALSGAKHFLGIGSPSRVFADQVGKWIPHGVAVGVDQYARVAHRAIERMSAGMLLSGSAAAPALAGAGGLAYAGAGGRAPATVIHQHFDFRQAHVMNERDLDQLVQKFGRVLATRTLPQGGVRLA